MFHNKQARKARAIALKEAAAQLKNQLGPNENRLSVAFSLTELHLYLWDGLKIEGIPSSFNGFDVVIHPNCQLGRERAMESIADIRKQLDPLDPLAEKLPS